MSRKSATDIGIRPLSAGTDPPRIGETLPFGIPQRGVLQIGSQSWHSRRPSGILQVCRYFVFVVPIAATGRVRNGCPSAVRCAAAQPGRTKSCGGFRATSRTISRSPPVARRSLQARMPTLRSCVRRPSSPSFPASLSAKTRSSGRGSGPLWGLTRANDQNSSSDSSREMSFRIVWRSPRSGFKKYLRSAAM